jgi:hypothetical protein
VSHTRSARPDESRRRELARCAPARRQGAADAAVSATMRAAEYGRRERKALPARPRRAGRRARRATTS